MFNSHLVDFGQRASGVRAYLAAITASCDG